MVTGSTPRFAADVMLGRLARWLRALGCDVAYGSHLHGRPLVRLARDEQRVLLTREKRLLRDATLPQHVFVTSDRFRDQLTQIASVVPLSTGAAFSRCLPCNRPLDEVAPEDVRGRIPPRVYARQTGFQRCPRCRRCYWPATHRAGMERQMAALGIGHG